MLMTLHSNMFLLIQICSIKVMCNYLTLHSNMFLLILKGENYGLLSSSSFTFQYVSINTQKDYIEGITLSGFTFQYVSINTFLILNGADRVQSLHSNMFLLIQPTAREASSTLCSLHSNMFLLIRHRFQ